VDHVGSWKIIIANDTSLAPGTTADPSAFSKQFGPGGPMDLAVDTQQRFIGRIDDRIDVDAGDISLKNLLARGRKFDSALSSRAGT
jgi:hypothetical protein